MSSTEQIEREQWMDRATRLEADLAALREAAQDVVETFDEWPDAHRAAINGLRAVLASADSEEER